MGYYNFNIDLPNAELIADKFEKLLGDCGYKTVRAPNRYFPDWDIKAIHPETHKIMTFEIKYDEMSELTGNVAIEFECRGKKSGISTTKAIYWVQYFDNQFYVVSTEILKNKMFEMSDRCVSGGDAGSNTKMYLIKKEKFKLICNVKI